MALSAGTRLGAYEIVAALGAGGMGEVYRARDPKLGRDVALKLLPTLFAADPQRIARLEREAHVLASLNHPNIAQIYGLEDSTGVRALVMELVEGPTLADRIAQGPVSLDEALQVARQIAEALEVAHEQGVIHRDLKPDNIKLRPDGVVKVLDFGLAKLADEPAASGGEGLSRSPTITTPARMTNVGAILGTAAYMSPEQAQGRPADKRVDIWAFGCVLYEMLTGTRAFGGDSIGDILAKVIEREPDWRALPGTTPVDVRRLLARCLKKDVKARMRDIGDARLQIDEVLSGVREEAGTRAIIRDLSLWRRAWPWEVMAGLTLVVVALALWAPWRSTAAPSPSVHLSTELDVDGSLVIALGAGVGSAAAALSRDGQMLAFVARKESGTAPQLWIRRLDQLQATPLAGTENARDPFWSPDGKWVGFFANRRLEKIAVSGGATVTLCDVPDARGGTWTDEGTIVFTPNFTDGVSLLRVSDTGGTPEPLIPLALNEATQRWPQSLPGGKAILFTSHTTTSANFDDADIVVQTLPGGPRTIVQHGGYWGRYVSSGHVVFVRGKTLYAVAFDLNRLETHGLPVPVIDNLAANAATGGAQVAVSNNGTLVYLDEGAPVDARIDWMDRGGKITPLRATSAFWSNPQFSPDGRRLAVEIADGKQAHIWVYELTRDILTRLTFDAALEERPIWTPDGRQIVFTTNRGKGASNLYWRHADGTGQVQRLTNSPNNQRPGSWHPTGKFLAFGEDSPQTYRVMILPMEGDDASGWRPGKAAPFLNTPFEELEPTFSPDGRWIAYLSNESGIREVYVRPFPGPGGKWQISTNGGDSPTWSRTRPELFYGTADRRIMVVPYTVEGATFNAEKPRFWSESRYGQRGRRSFDLHPDGNRFVVGPDLLAPQNHVVFIFNFFDELRRMAPVTN